MFGWSNKKEKTTGGTTGPVNEDVDGTVVPKAVNL